MPRYAKKSIITDLRNKFKEYITALRNDGYEEESVYWYDFIDFCSCGNQLLKDLSKIEFDLENNSIETVDDLCDESKTLEYSVSELNGILKQAISEDPKYAVVSLPSAFIQLKDYAVLLCWGGGDWECPVLFIMYLDNKNKLRAYVPNKGNTFNPKFKSAFGNNDDYPEDDIGILPNFDLMFEDIKNRIIIKEN